MSNCFYIFDRKHIFNNGLWDISWSYDGNLQRYVKQYVIKYVICYVINYVIYYLVKYVTYYVINFVIYYVIKYVIYYVSHYVSHYVTKIFTELFNIDPDPEVEEQRLRDLFVEAFGHGPEKSWNHPNFSWFKSYICK